MVMSHITGLCDTCGYFYAAGLHVTYIATGGRCNIFVVADILQVFEGSSKLRHTGFNKMLRSLRSSDMFLTFKTFEGTVHFNMLSLPLQSH